MLLRMTMRRHLFAGIIVPFLHMAPATGFTSPPSMRTSDPPRVKTFAPGIRLDWRDRVVVVDAEVVLREGPLELFACSPHTREHESVLAVHAGPMRIFQAMGLIGLVPGSPVSYDEKADRWNAPTGQPTRVRVRFSRGGVRRVVPAAQWMRDVRTHRPPQDMPWVFAGSRTFSDGRFGADLDGTVVCVVDFDTALITVGALHSADNELLWLEANTEAIPPLGTRCELLIDSAIRWIEVTLSADGRLRERSRETSAADIARAVSDKSDDDRPVRVALTADPSIGADTVEAATKALVRAGIDPTSITRRHKKPKGSRGPGPVGSDPQTPPPSKTGRVKGG